MPEQLTAADLVDAIRRLPRRRAYRYVHSATRTLVEIVDIVPPEGPISVVRYDPSSGGSRSSARVETISTHMLWRVANALSPQQPINLDRILGGSYNTRSALEALLAHTPQFYYCYPGRIESLSSSTRIQAGHKHILWCPNTPHEEGVLRKVTTDVVISEIPSAQAIYESLTLPDGLPGQVFDLDLARRHAQMQVALVEIGAKLGISSWVAKNDHGIVYRGRRLVQLESVLPCLQRVQWLQSLTCAISAATYIDCIWFRNTRYMPAVFEVEHSTGITSGLTRMKTFQDSLPSINTRYIIVAPDEDRQGVLREAAKEQFRALHPAYLPYSSVEELLSLCQRRSVVGVNDDFIATFLEPCAT